MNDDFCPNVSLSLLYKKNLEIEMYNFPFFLQKTFLPVLSYYQFSLKYLTLIILKDVIIKVNNAYNVNDAQLFNARCVILNIRSVRTNISDTPFQCQKSQKCQK